MGGASDYTTCSTTRRTHTLIHTHSFFPFILLSHTHTRVHIPSHCLICNLIRPFLLSHTHEISPSMAASPGNRLDFISLHPNYLLDNAHIHIYTYYSITVRHVSPRCPKGASRESRSDSRINTAASALSTSLRLSRKYQGFPPLLWHTLSLSTYSYTSKQHCPSELHIWWWWWQW